MINEKEETFAVLQQYQEMKLSLEKAHVDSLLSLQSYNSNLYTFLEIMYVSERIILELHTIDYLIKHSVRK